MSAKVVNLDALELREMKQGDRFECRTARIGALLGAKGLGCSYDVVPPGKRACPFHSHRANEELFVILSGTGTLRYGDTTRPIRAGDVISCPVGGPETAHQIVNDSDADLRYLAISTMISPEVCEYPDSDKMLAYDREGFRLVVGRSAGVDYWQGES